VTEIRDSAGAPTTADLDAAFGHHGSLQDQETGLQLKGARWYSPGTGRFVSVDPIQDGTNWYAFAGNDPVNYGDPSGLTPAFHPLSGFAGGTLSAPKIGGPSQRIPVAPSPMLTQYANRPSPAFQRELQALARADQASAQQRGFTNVTSAFQAAGREAERERTAIAAINARSAAQQRSVLWAGAGGAVRGLGTGSKSVVNGASSTLVSAATLGFKSYDGPLGVTQYDRDVSYDTANFLHRAAGEIVVGVATGGLSTASKAGTATRLVSKTALAYDTTENVLSAGRGSIDAVQNGLSVGNSLQIVGGGLGVGGNVAAGGRALGEIATDLGRVRVDGTATASMMGLGAPIRLAPKGVAAYEVGTYKDLARRSIGDDLVIHHVGQGHPMGQVVAGYDYSVAPAIALPRTSHVQIPNLKGEYAGTARDLIARDIRNLRSYTNVPNSALKQLLELNKTTYPGAFVK
jgi:RHS repeat-associated protein